MEISLLGWFHTILGIGAIVAVISVLVKDKQIGITGFANQFYLVATVLTAVSALGIHKHGDFHAAHMLGVLTILAVAAGVFASKVNILGGLNKYFIALCFTATILFHALPTATEIVTRFPMDAPLATGIKDPLLQKIFPTILAVWLVAFIAQLVWIRKNID